MSFVDFARANGVDIDNSQLYPSDKIRRTGTLERPKSTNGAYFWDGQRGWVMDWSGEARPVWYQDPYAKPWTDEDKRQWAAKRANSASAQDKAYERAAEQAAVDARGEGGAASASDDDPKNVGPPRELLERRVEQRTKERDAKEKENAALKRKIEELEEQMKTAAKVINFSKDCSHFNFQHLH